MRDRRPERTRAALTAAFVAVLVAARVGSADAEQQAGPGPLASPTATPAVAVATGRLVDNLTGLPLPGISIALAPATSPSSEHPVEVARTDATGSFTFSVAPDAYFLVVGQNDATSGRTVVHASIVLDAGNNPLVMGTPNAEPNVMVTAGEASGDFRTEQLSPTQRNCLDGANFGRRQHGLRELMPDETLFELASATVAEAVAQDTDTPVPLFDHYDGYEPSLFEGGTGSADFAPCSEWTGKAFSYILGTPAYRYATNATNIYYGADLRIASAGSKHLTYGYQAWGADPRSTAERAPAAYSAEPVIAKRFARSLAP